MVEKSIEIMVGEHTTSHHSTHADSLSLSLSLSLSVSLSLTCFFLVLPRFCSSSFLPLFRLLLFPAPLSPSCLCPFSPLLPVSLSHTHPLPLARTQKIKLPEEPPFCDACVVNCVHFSFTTSLFLITLP